LAPFCFGRLAAGLRLGRTALFFFLGFALRFLSGLTPSFHFGGTALRFFGRFTLHFRFSCSPRLGVYRPTPSFGLRLDHASRLGLFGLASSLCFGRLAAGLSFRRTTLFFLCGFALRFLSDFSPSFHFGGSAFRFFGRFTLRFRFSRSASLRLFRPTSCVGFGCLTFRLRLDRTASFRLLSGLAPCLGFRGLSRLRFGRASLLGFDRAPLLCLRSPTLCFLVRRTTVGGFLCPPFLLSRPVRASLDNSLGEVPRRHDGATAEVPGEVESRPASRHRSTAHSDECIASWSAPHSHDGPREGNGLLAIRRQRRRLWRLGQRNDGRSRQVSGPRNTRRPGRPTARIRIRYFVERRVKPACRARVVEEKGPRATAVPEGQNGLPGLCETCRVYGRLRPRDRRRHRLTTAKPTEHFDRVALPDVPAKLSNRIGDRTLVEGCERDLHVRFDENVRLERERAVESLSEEQSNDRLFRIAAREGLDLTEG
jgi:hypothetical protein